MRERIKLTYCAAAALLLASCAKAPAPYGALPTPYQVEWQKMETNMFVHFGPNTFTGAEWGNGAESEDLFNPSDLDCRQWTSVARAAGFKGVIITAKHHDGFCLWPNPVCNHTVAQSCWRDGKGDVLAELSDACKADGLKFGVYVSPWDRNDPNYGTDNYNDIFVKTLESALGSYGHVFEQWFDGACGEGPSGKRQVYDWPLFNSTVFRLQPHAIIFSNVGPGCRWMGNEEGSNGRTCWSTMNITGYTPSASPSMEIMNTGEKGGDTWVGSETDVSIRPGWFWKESENAKVKSVQELLKIYYESVGRNSVLLLNVPADTRGHIHEVDSVRLVEWRSALDSIFARNLADGATAAADNCRGCRFGAGRVLDGDYDTYWAAEDGVTSATLTINLPEARTFNRICLQEYIPLGQRVEAFEVLAADEDGNLVSIAHETTIGYKRIVLLPTVTTSQVVVKIISAAACPAISSLSLYQDDIFEDREVIHEAGKVFDMTEPQILNLGSLKTISEFTYTPAYRGEGGVIETYDLYASRDGEDWQKIIADGMFENIVNNPIAQHVSLPLNISALYLKLVPNRTSNGATYGVVEFSAK